ncbi:MAG: Ppx/GppA family phosphatase [Rhodospirillaceae bacterium]|nr:Ppx/GppA family phosphatase [Rhodospirillaceae bacterium]
MQADPLDSSARRPATGRRPGGDERQRPVAAIDLGSNNCRLLVARPNGGGFHVIDAFSRIVRLGEGVGHTGLLSPAAIERCLEALSVCAAKMRRRGVGRHRAVATEACRRAGNFKAFKDRVTDVTGIALEVISPGEEARLALKGCAELLDPGLPRALMFDIGGGSTELIWLRVDGDRRARPSVIDAVSLPLGVVLLAERHGGDRVPAEAYEAIVAETRQSLENFDRRHGIGQMIAQGRVQMIGSSGTVTTLAGIFQGLKRYDRSLVDGSFLDFCEVARISRELCELDFDGRAAHPCIGRDRADLVVGGCAVLEAICRQWPVGRLRIGDRGVREGILLDLIAGRRGRPLGPRQAVHPPASV